MIRALVFDFDGLILDTETPIIDAWVSIHNEAGIPHVREDAARVVGHVDMDYDPWEAFDRDVDRDALEKEHKRRSRSMLERQQILPGVKEYLEKGKALGLQLAIASNSPHVWVDTHLKRLGLFDLFNVIRCRDDVARGKPEPELYQSVLTAFGISGSEAIAFEDSSAGSLAAKRAGLWCVAVPNPSTFAHAFDHVDLQVTSLAEVRLEDLLRRWECPKEQSGR